MKNVFFLRGFHVHLENKDILKSYTARHLVLNGFCDEIISQANRKEISVPFSLGLSNIPLASLFRIPPFLLGKEGYPVNFLLNIPCLGTAARNSPLIEHDTHHNNLGLMFIIEISVTWQETYLWSLANDGPNP